MSNQNKKKISLIQECTNEYNIEEEKNNVTKITILIPKRFSNLWLHKLSELQTTMEEIKEYE
jgi:hypothetical protein